MPDHLLVNGEPFRRERVNNVKNYVPINPLTAEWALWALTDFPLANARPFYSSMGNTFDGKGLEARSKELKKDGKGNKPKAAEAITDEEVNILYDKQLLGISNAEALLNTMWFMNTKHFGLRGWDEHCRMKWGDVQLLTDVNGAEYLEFSERQTKREPEPNLGMSEQLNCKL